MRVYSIVVYFLQCFKVESLFRKYHKRVEVLLKKKLRQPTSLSVKSKLHEALPDPLVAGGHSSHCLSLGKEEEDVCPICLSDLVDGESMTVCHEGCKNQLHHHCMAVCKFSFQSLHTIISIHCLT